MSPDARPALDRLWGHLARLATDPHGNAHGQPKPVLEPLRLSALCQAARDLCEAERALAAADQERSWTAVDDRPTPLPDPDASGEGELD